MINPNILVVEKVKLVDRARGKKVYAFRFAGFKLGHRIFKTATEALEYGRRVKSRYCRLYEAAVLNMMDKDKSA